jgi:hypothetical protein
LQARYGISLKDACQRLYMAETAKLSSIDTAEKTLTIIRQRIDKTMEDEIRRPIDAIDKGIFDDHVVPHGKWPQNEHGVAEGTADSD